MSGSAPNCVFFKKRIRKTVRTKKESSSSEEEAVEVRQKKKRPDVGALFQKTTKFTRNSQDIYDEEEEKVEDSDAITMSYKASYSTESRLNREQLATATLEIDTDHSHDAQAIFERAQQMNMQQRASKSNVYLGVNNYAQYIEKKDTVMGNASSGFNRKGPMRAPLNIRATVRWDYQPDICKDYKETGFCSFGDSCKFLHDRSDYKHGWQIDQELAEGTFGTDGSDNRYEIIHHSSDDEADAGEDIPWECLICRKEYKDPVVTICRHYFCSECALKRYRKTARCYVCTADTKGTFKFAKNVLSRVAELRAKSHQHKHKSEDEDEYVTSCSGEHLSQRTCRQSSPTISSSSVAESTQAMLSVPSKSKWAQPEAPGFCSSDDESD